MSAARRQRDDEIIITRCINSLELDSLRAALQTRPTPWLLRGRRASKQASKQHTNASCHPPRFHDRSIRSGHCLTPWRKSTTLSPRGNRYTENKTAMRVARLIARRISRWPAARPFLLFADVAARVQLHAATVTLARARPTAGTRLTSRHS